MGSRERGGSAPYAQAPQASVEDLDLESMAAWLRPLGSPIRLKLLRFLTRPHYLEEVASHLKLTRQAARKHLDQLVSIGVLDKRSGTRASGPVTEYIINPQALFLIYDEFEKLGSLRRDERLDMMARTREDPGRSLAVGTGGGPSFIVVRGLRMGERFPLSAKKPFVVGRDERCDLILGHDPYASNRHAEVAWEPGVGFVLEDLRATNGTQHNLASLPRGGSVSLSHGDLVGVGKTLLLFWEK